MASHTGIGSVEAISRNADRLERVHSPLDVTAFRVWRGSVGVSFRF